MYLELQDDVLQVPHDLNVFLQLLVLQCFQHFLKIHSTSEIRVMFNVIKVAVVKNKYMKVLFWFWFLMAQVFCVCLKPLRAILKPSWLHAYVNLRCMVPQFFQFVL